jgi:amino acid adenylation domain-containing protein
MTVYELLARLQQVDARVIAEGDRLRFDAPEGAIDADLRAEIVRQKPRLLEVLRHARRPAPDNDDALVRAGRVEAEASFAQQRLWFVTQLLPDSPMYNVPTALRLRGTVDVPALERALTEIVRRHESLRTTFRDGDGRTLQVIHPPRPVTVAIDDLRANPFRETRARAIVATEAARLFDLRRDLMLRARLVRLADDESLLLITLHHIASDGWSMKLLFDELSALYDNRTLPELPVQYADFATWQRAALEQEDNGSLAYWCERLAGLEVLELPSDFARPAQMTFRGGRESLALDADLVRDLRAAGREEGITLFMSLLAAYAMLLHRTTGRTDLAIGSPVAGRDRAEVEELIGFFVNSVIIRARVDGATSFRELLAAVRQGSLDAWAHQDVPFERLVEILQPQRDLRHNPLFQTMFAIRQESASAPRLGALETSVEEVETTTAKFDLAMEVEERGDALTVHLSYSSDLFEAATVRRMLGHYATLLRSALDDRDAAIAGLQLMPNEERITIMERFNDTAVEYERDAALASLFEAQVERTPDAIAAFTADGAQRVTYRELNERASALAATLRERGAAPEVAVGLQMDRSIEMLVAILAIAKTGAAYVPLEPSFPAERRRVIAEDARVALLISDDGVTATGIAATPTNARANGDTLAYITYTSGSTGTPKGVAISNRAVARLARHNDFAPVAAGDVVLQYAPLAFDASTFEVWATLLNGATLLVMPQHASLEELGAAIRQHGVTALWLTAGLFHLMADQRLADFAGVRHLLAGGDVLSPAHVERVLRAHPSLHVVNGYGPTENTTFTCCHRMAHADAGSIANGVPIGRPIRNTRVYILDRNLQPLPIGVPGELFAAGDGLARGYAHDPALTAEKFIPNPFVESDRLYRTGDLARWRADGTIEFLGRIDHQVKIRGYRIELAEIELVLRAQDGVRDAVVIVRQENGDKRLVAYVAGAPAELRPALKQLLPDYMIPAAFVFLPELPLNANGKVDRARLPAPEREVRAAAATPLGSDTERMVAAVWEELLGAGHIGVHDNFFDAGGHSLLLLQMRTKLVEQFGKDIPLMEMFRKPTIRAMADFLDARTAPMAADGVVHHHNQRAQLRRMSVSKRKQFNEERQNRS